jgi:hypothetical protein
LLHVQRPEAAEAAHRIGQAPHEKVVIDVDLLCGAQLAEGCGDRPTQQVVVDREFLEVGEEAELLWDGSVQLRTETGGPTIHEA